MTGRTTDLNADVGEGCGYDADLMPFITSANVAAGYHAGSPAILRATIALAKRYGVNIGAHPGFRDPENFGRRELALTHPQIATLVTEQLEIVAHAARAADTRMAHVKPHGALYNMAARDGAVAGVVARAISAFDTSLTLFAPPHSQLFIAGMAAGLRVAGEGFADRAYNPDGSLVSRNSPGAVIVDEAIAVSRAMRMVTDGLVAAIDGSDVRLRPDTICVHGDTAGCVALAQRLKSALSASGTRSVS